MNHLAFKIRGQNKSSAAIMSSSLPRFSYASVAARLADEQLASHNHRRGLGQGSNRGSKTSLATTSMALRRSQSLGSDDVAARSIQSEEDTGLIPGTSVGSRSVAARSLASENENGLMSPTPSGRTIQVSTYSSSHSKKPHLSAVTVPTQDPATLPKPSLQPRIRSADPELMTPWAKQHQRVHMKYIGLTPQ